MGIFSKFLGDGRAAPEPAGSAPAGGVDDSIGGTLRRARETKGYSVADIAQALRIRRTHLEAIEANRFGELPGALYAAGFIRSYAALVEADSEALVRRFRQQPGGTVATPQLVLPAPPAEPRLPGGAVMLVAVVLAVSTYGAWYYLSATDRSLSDVVPGLPDEFAAMLDERPDDAADASGGYQASAANADELPPGSIDELIGTLDPGPADDAAHGGAAGRGAATPAAAVDPLPVTTLSSLAVPAPRTGDQPAGNRIVLRAAVDSWVQVADRQGKAVMATLLRPGQVYEVPAEADGLTLDTGNAGGLEIQVGDRVIPRLGGQGQVVRGIPLDAAALLARASPG